MLGHLPETPTHANPATLLPWLKATLLGSDMGSIPELHLKLRGNILHVLCEFSQNGPNHANLSALSASAPAQTEVLLRLVRSLMEPDIKARFDRQFPQIHQVYVYSRLASEAKPVWSAPIYLNRLEQHLERLIERSCDQPAATTSPASSEVIHSSDLSIEQPLEVLEVPEVPEASEVPEALEVSAVPETSNLQRARQGDSEAIAQYLSEALSALNVGVKVNARVVPGKARRAQAIPNAESEQDLVSRLWVFCEASYSPDPLLIAEPIAARLRRLHLQQFQDAVITIQVTGETASDWRLRVDLTPPDIMLREWAKWGDLPAISRLANQISQPYGLKLIAEVKKETLHLISYPLKSGSDESGKQDADGRDSSKAQIDIEALVSALSQQLRAIAPQGIQRAMIYGPSTDDISPEWLRGLDLPAAQQLDLAPSAAALAAQGNLPALVYSLTRALNPDIKEQLATGGIRVQLLLKDDLMYVMADGPVCPPKHAIVPLVAQTLAPLKATNAEASEPALKLEGLRLYGRRAGQKQPIWTHGHDYTPRQRLVPEAKPKFAASEAYIGELITPISEQSLTADLERTAEAETDVKLGALLLRALQYVMLKSQVFVLAEVDENLPSQISSNPLSAHLPRAFQIKGGKMALLWGALGLLLAVHIDFLVGKALQQAAQPLNRTDVLAQSDAQATGMEPIKPNRYQDDLDRLNWGKGESLTGSAPATDDSDLVESSDRFDSDDFTASAIDDGALIYSPQQDMVSTTTLLADSTLPSFRSQQLDEKLALYRQQVARSGPPDVLVIGSSRALRGVDPAALRKALAQSGHEGLSVFNFGVNGATAQVVDLIVRRLIAPDQLPQIIVWADGARAFNSGRVDVTFNAIATSDGYEQLQANSSAAGGGIEALVNGGLATQLTNSAKQIDRQLSDLLGQVSAGYSYRDQIRATMGRSYSAIAPSFTTADDPINDLAGDTPTELPTETSLIDLDGFLPLSIRFNPATYYQDHARVAGDYDGDYKAFQLVGKQTAALDSLVQFTAQKQIPLVFINTPLTDEYLDSYRTRSETEFLQYMVTQAERTPVMLFRNLGQLWPQNYDYFSDPSHLNRYGAYQVSQRLAQDPLIPWPQALPPEEKQVEK